MAPLRLVQIFCLIAVVCACSEPEDWKEQTMLERVVRSKVLVYGEVKEIKEMDTDGIYEDVEYTLDIYCVLRNQADPSVYVGGSITVHELYTGGECVFNKYAMVEGKKVIVMLTNHYYDYDPNQLKFQNDGVQDAVFEGNEANLNTVAKSCQFFGMMAPGDSVNKECPAIAQREYCSELTSTANNVSQLLLTPPLSSSSGRILDYVYLPLYGTDVYSTSHSLITKAFGFWLMGTRIL